MTGAEAEGTHQIKAEAGGGKELPSDPCRDGTKRFPGWPGDRRQHQDQGRPSHRSLPPFPTAPAHPKGVCSLQAQTHQRLPCPSQASGSLWLAGQGWGPGGEPGVLTPMLTLSQHCPSWALSPVTACPPKLKVPGAGAAVGRAVWAGGPGCRKVQGAGGAARAPAETVP